MKAFTSFILMCVTAITSLAQVNPGWQTGGGFGNTESQPYHFDIPRTNRHPQQPQGHEEYQPYNPSNNTGYSAYFNGGHQDAPYAFTIGYVNKVWRTDFGDYVYKENFWGEENKHLHGFQLGVVFQPCLPVGLGLHTGLFYEAYFSVSPAVKRSGWSNFTESGLYIPLHAMYRLPLGRTSSLSIFGGVAMNWAISGRYTDTKYIRYNYDYDYGYGYDYDYEYAVYGRDGWPRRLNFQWEIGASVRISSMQLSFTYSKGITDHGFYHKDGNYKTTQDKIGVSLSFLLNDNVF